MKVLANILTDAFIDDPLMEFLFKEDKRKNINILFDFILKYSKASGDIIMTQGDQHITSLACVERPKSTKSIAIVSSIKKFFLMMGFPFKLKLKSFRKLNLYMQATSRHRPKGNHYYLVCIAVDPKHQGLGLGKQLLNDIHKLVDNDKNSIGIGLDTENPDNVKIYEKFGYKLTGEEVIGDIRVYTMFRESLKNKL